VAVYFPKFREPVPPQQPASLFVVRWRWGLVYLFIELRGPEYIAVLNSRRSVGQSVPRWSWWCCCRGNPGSVSSTSTNVRSRQSCSHYRSHPPGHRTISEPLQERQLADEQSDAKESRVLRSLSQPGTREIVASWILPHFPARKSRRNRRLPSDRLVSGRSATTANGKSSLATLLIRLDCTAIMSCVCLLAAYK